MKTIMSLIILAMLSGCLQVQPEPMQTPVGAALLALIIAQQGNTAGAAKK